MVRQVADGWAERTGGRSQCKDCESWNLLIDQRDDNCGCSNRCWSYLATGLHCAFDFPHLVIIEDDAQSALHDPARNSHSDGGHYQAVDERQENLENRRNACNDHVFEPSEVGRLPYPAGQGPSNNATYGSSGEYVERDDGKRRPCRMVVILPTSVNQVVGYRNQLFAVSS